MNSPALTGLTLTLILACAAPAAPPEQLDVFIAGQGDYHTYRIPAMVVTTKGTVLIFCEGRRRGAADSGDIDLLLKRSTDGGKTFSAPQVVWDDGPNTCGNPCPIVDRQTGDICLLMTRNLGADRESDITAGRSRESRTVWVTRSEDDGQSWSKPVEITHDVKNRDWTWYATGSGAGIQTAAGRLIAPCDHNIPANLGYSHTIYSDDHGRSWKLGGVAGPKTNESRIVEISDGRLLLNMRNYKSGKDTRALATSADAGRTWSSITYDPVLIDPTCQASLLRLPGPTPQFLFANPASAKREKLTVRLSQDDCKTWPHAKQLHPGPSAYSDLAALPDGTLLCLYERGEKSPYEKITLARFSLDWLKE